MENQFQQTDNDIKVERTGRQYSVASSEFLVTFPDGKTMTIWSPPWHELTVKGEEIRALQEAQKIWNNRNVKDII